MTIGGQTFTIDQAGACTYAIAPTSQTVGAAGGTGTPVTVTAAAGCNWSASSSVPWISITSGATGTGSGTVGFSIAPNTSSARSGTMTIAGQTFSVDQAGACTYSLVPTSLTIGADGGPGTVAVTAAPGCSWSAISGASWLSVTAGASGSGAGTVAFTASANPSSARSGVITIAGQAFTVAQAGCSLAVNPTSFSLDMKGGNGTIDVSASSSCGWTATSNDSWIRITSSASGTGNGVITFSVDEIPPPRRPRTGTITIGGTTVTIGQKE
jgi:hypothetical protein